MKNKMLFPVAFLVIATSLLPACNKSDTDPYTDPKEEAWWGYFEGTVDGSRAEDDMKISFENSKDVQRTKTNSSEAVVPEDLHRNRIINTGIVYFGDSESTNAYFSLSLSGLYPGIKHITKPYWTYGESDDMYSTISLFRKYSAGAPAVEYVPSEEDPFEITILDVDWFPGSSFPAIEAKLDGTLYNKDNPQESITVHAVYGSR